MSKKKPEDLVDLSDLPEPPSMYFQVHERPDNPELERDYYTEDPHPPYFNG